jgi:ribosomal protein S18 acetylase RimI-like enzyme
MSYLMESGSIKMHRNHLRQEFVRYEMRFLDENALQDILNLQELISRGLPSPEIFRMHDEDYFSSLFKSERSVIGVIVDESLIAYSLIYIPGKGEENLGRDVGLPEEELEHVAHLQAAVVHPAYRGNGLQKRMNAAHLRVIEEMGFEHVLCTVSPKNPFSLRNIFSNGFVVRGLKPKFEGAWRYIMYKSLLHAISFRCETVSIRGSDIEGQVDLLSRGYLGFGIRLLSADFEVCYGLASFILQERNY